MSSCPLALRRRATVSPTPCWVRTGHQGYLKPTYYEWWGILSFGLRANDFGTRTWLLRCQCCWYDNQKLLWNGHIWLHLQTLKIQTFLIETDQLKNELGSLSTPKSPHSKSTRTPKLWSSCQRYETSCRTSNILLKGSYLQSLAQGVATNFNRLKSNK